jgi:hypothetical protein
MMAESAPSSPSIQLFSDGLLSKWGFNDGDAPDEWLDWCDDHGIDHSALPSWRDYILPALVRRFLVTALTQDVQLVSISTIHNPIRAETVDGINVEEWWRKSAGAGAPQLTPEYVAVTLGQILEVAKQVSSAGR